MPACHRPVSGFHLGIGCLLCTPCFFFADGWVDKGWHKANGTQNVNVDCNDDAHRVDYVGSCGGILHIHTSAPLGDFRGNGHRIDTLTLSPSVKTPDEQVAMIRAATKTQTCWYNKHFTYNTSPFGTSGRMKMRGDATAAISFVTPSFPSLPFPSLIKVPSFSRTILHEFGGR